jgi:threonine synthase
LKNEGTSPVVTLATAHPAKFPDAVEAAIGVRPALPPRLADLSNRSERITRLPANAEAVARFVSDHSRAIAGAAA